MKKLGIFAIGTLLFFEVSCDQNKTSLAPASPATETITPAPGGIRNDEQVNPGASTLKTSKNPEITIRNDENINGNTSTDRSVRTRPVRNDIENPYNDPQRKAIGGDVRNDIQNPYNDPR